MYSKKGLSVLVATVLLLVIVIFGVVMFQKNISFFQSKKTSEIEQTTMQDAMLNIGIKTVLGDTLYLDKNVNYNLTIYTIEALGKVCASSEIFSSTVQSFNISNCTDTLTSPTTTQVKITTNKGVFTQKLTLPVTYICSPATCISCSNNQPQYLSDDVACGTLDCDGLDNYYISGTQSALATSYCHYVNYADLSSNRCLTGSCKLPNVFSTCSSFTNTTTITAGLCKYVSGCSGSTPGTLSNYPSNTVCGSFMQCDGSGNCLQGNVKLSFSGNPGYYSSIVLSSTNYPLIFYYNDSAAGYLSMYRCLDANCVSGVLRRLDSAVSTGLYPSVVLSGSLPIISYYDSGNADLKVYSCADANCTSGSSRTVDSSGNVGMYSTIKTSSANSGYPIISYYDETNRKVKVYQCSNAVCSTGGSNTVPTGDTVWYMSSMTVRSGGLPFISYYEGGSGRIYGYDCSNVACSSGTSRTIEAGTQGGYNKVILGSDGNPLVIYRQGSSLYSYKCSNSVCSSGTTTSGLFSGSINGLSVVLGSDNNAVIAFRDGNTNMLTMFKCSDASCTSGSSRVLDSTSGDDTSIALSSDTLPIISYKNATNGYLSFYKCKNIYCS